MNADELKDLIRRPAVDAQRQLDCPNDYDIASYMDGGLSEQGHQLLELHLADCDFCLQRVGLIGRAIDLEAETGVPELLLARSARLVHASNSRVISRFRQRLIGNQRWAAVAVLVLALGLFINQKSPWPTLTESGVSAGSPEPAHQERNIGPFTMVPRLISPVEDSIINPGSQSFTWLPVRDSLYYQVRIVSDEGDLLWQERLTQTQWRLPTQISLEADSEYFVRIDAFLTETKSLNSDYVLFKVQGKR